MIFSWFYIKEKSLTIKNDIMKIGLLKFKLMLIQFSSRLGDK